MKGKVGRATQHDGLGSRAPNLLDAITVSSKSDPCRRQRVRPAGFGLSVRLHQEQLNEHRIDGSRRFVRFGERLLPDMHAFTGQDCLVPEADLSAMRC